MERKGRTTLATLANLRVGLSLDAGSFQRGVRASIEQSQQFASSVKRSFNKAEASATGAMTKISTGAKLAIGGVLVGAATAGVAAIGSLATSIVGAAAGFEQGLSNISAVSGATAAEMEQISDLALRLGKDTSFSASQAAAGIEELIKGGVGIADVMSGAADATLNLAAAGGVDLATAAEISANALAMFNLEGSDMAMVADQIAGAANASSLSVTDFKFSLAAAGSVMAASSQSIESTATAIALMGQAGIKGSDAGTSLKAAFNNLIPTTDKASAKMKELGIITADGVNQFLNLDGSFKQTGEIAQVLQKSLAGLSDSQRTLALETIFGSDGMRAGIVLAKAGAAGFDEMAASMGKVTAASVGAMRLDNLRGDMEQLSGSLETAGITLGTVFLPALRDLAQGATAVVNKTIPLIETYGPGLVGGIGAVADVISDNAVPALTAISAATLAYGLTSIPAMSASLTTAIASLTTAIPLLYAKGAALTASLGPFALVAGAAFLTAKAYDAWNDGIQATVDKQLASNEVLQGVIALQEQVRQSTDLQTPAIQRQNMEIDAQIQKYNDLAVDLQKRLELEEKGIRSQERTAGAIAQARAALTEQEGAYLAATEKLKTLIQWEETLAYTQGRAADGGSAYVGYINSATAAYGGASEGIAALGAVVGPTEEELTKLNEALVKTATEGASALGSLVDTTISFQDDMTAAATGHWAKIAEIDKALGGQITADRRAELETQRADLSASYSTQQQERAVAYATESAALRAHLGEMLIETVNSWVLMGKVPVERAQEMNAALATEYGVAASNSQLMFGQMVGDLLNWRDNAGVSSDSVIGDLQTAGQTAVDTEKKMDALTGDYVATLYQNFQDGKIDADELTDALGRVPREVSVQIQTNAAAAAAAVDSASNALDRLAARANQTVNIRANIPRPILAQSPSPMEESLTRMAAIIKSMPTLDLKATGLGEIKSMIDIVKSLGSAGASLGGLNAFTSPSAASIDAFAASTKQVITKLAAVASHFKAKALEHAASFAESAGKVLSLIGAGVDGLTKISSYEGVTRDAVVRFGNDLYGTVSTLQVIVRDFDRKGLEAAVAWSESAGKVVGIVGGGVDGLTKIADYRGVSRNAVLLFGNDLYGTVSTLQVIVRDFDQDGIAAAADWSESASKLVSLVGSGVEALTKIASYRGVSRDAVLLFGNDLYGVISTLQVIVRDFDRRGVEQTAIFAESASRIVGLIGTAIGAFEKLRDYEDVPTAHLELLAADIDDAVWLIQAIARVFDQEGMDQAAAFAESAGNVVGLIGDAVTSFQALATYEDIATSRMEMLAADIDDVVWLMTDLARTADADGTEAAALFATAVGKILVPISEAVNAFTSLRDYEGIMPWQIDMLGADIRLTVDKMVDMASKFDADGVEAAAVFGTAVGKILAPITTAIDAFTKLKDYKGVAPEAVQLIASDIMGTVAHLTILAQAADIEGAQAAATFADASGRIFAGMKSGIDTLSALNEYGGLDQEKVATFFGDIDRVLTQANALAAGHATLTGLAFVDAWQAKMLEMQPGFSGFLSSYVQTAGSSALTPASLAGQSIGSAVSDGIAAGITSGIPAIQAAAEAAAQSALNAAKATLGIASPSKRFWEIGENIMQSFAGAVVSQTPMLARALADTASTITSPFEHLTGSVGYEPASPTSFETPAVQGAGQIGNAGRDTRGEQPATVTNTVTMHVDRIDDEELVEVLARRVARIIADQAGRN